MKKLLSACFAVILILTMLPLNAMAAEESTSEYDELMALACEVFPEYASAIRGANTNTYALSRSTDNDEVVFSETRSISDTESLNLTQLASGNVIVLVSKSQDSVSITVPSSSTSDITTVGVAGTASFKVAATAASGYTFVLSNVSFTIYYYGSCYFTNYGSVTQSSVYSYTLKKQSSSEIIYGINFTAQHFTQLDLYFSNNQLYAVVS